MYGVPQTTVVVVAPLLVSGRSLWNGATGNQGGDYQILFSEDNGVTWTDDTAVSKPGRWWY